MPLAWEPPYATGVDLKRQKTITTKKKKWTKDLHSLFFQRKKPHKKVLENHQSSKPQLNITSCMLEWVASKRQEIINAGEDVREKGNLVR